MVKIIAEIGINHNGSLELAKKMIYMASKYNCDYVKFQKREISLVYTKEELDKPRESKWGTTTRDQKMGLEFGRAEYDEIDSYCKLLNMKWYASPWDPISVDFLMKYNPPYMKIPSALITNFELLEAVKNTGKPTIISTGMSTKDEVDACLNFMGDQVEYILACCSTYPTKDEEMNLKFIQTLIKEYGHKYKIGFSNHNPGTYYCTVAPALGAQMIEFHITLDRTFEGSDQAASIEEAGVRIITSHIRCLEVAMGTGEWWVRDSEIPIKNKLRFNTYKDRFTIKQ